MTSYFETPLRGQRIGGAVRPDMKPGVCPMCGSTDLRVELRAVFVWNGKDGNVGPDALRSCEHPVWRSSPIVCSECDWTGQVMDLQKKEVVDEAIRDG